MGPRDSLALPPWHSAARRVDRRGGKGIGSLIPRMSDPTWNPIKVVKEPFCSILPNMGQVRELKGNQGDPVPSPRPALSCAYLFLLLLV